MWKTFQKTLVKCRKGSEASGGELFIVWPEESRESNPHFFWWENCHHWFYLQQTEWSYCNVWEWRLWTPQSVNNQAPSPIMMFGAVSSNREKNSPNLIWTWLQASFYRLQSNLRTKLFHGSRRSLRNQIKSSNGTELLHPRRRLCRTGWTPTWAFDSKTFESPDLNPKVTSFKLLRLARHATATQMNSRLLWTAHGGRWGKGSAGRSASASEWGCTTFALAPAVSAVVWLLYLYLYIGIYYLHWSLRSA